MKVCVIQKFVFYGFEHITDACLGLFEDLENYSATPKDGAVLGKVSHESKGQNEVEITIKAFQVKARASKDEL